jgi:hypothetical protein
VEVSTDGGLTWTILTAANSIYLGTSPIFSGVNNFSSGAYSIWDPANAGTISNSWWQQETFDMSALCGNQASVSVRFRFSDQGNGMDGYYGWLIDNVSVVMSPCELLPPQLFLLQSQPAMPIQALTLQMLCSIIQ